MLKCEGKRIGLEISFDLYMQDARPGISNHALGLAILPDSNRPKRWGSEPLFFVTRLQGSEWGPVHVLGMYLAVSLVRCTWISCNQRLVLHWQQGPRPGLASLPDVAYGLILFRLLVWSLIPVGPIFVAPRTNPYPNPAYEGSNRQRRNGLTLPGSSINNTDSSPCKNADERRPAHVGNHVSVPNCGVFRLSLWHPFAIQPSCGSILFYLEEGEKRMKGTNHDALTFFFV